MDSGYHGTTDDEMDLDRFPLPITQADVIPSEPTPTVDAEPTKPSSSRVDRSHTEESSFVSAQSSFGQSKGLDENPAADDALPTETNADVVMSNATEAEVEIEAEQKEATPEAPLTADEDDKALEDAEDELVDDDEPSDGPSPVRQLARKSSLTFSSLPGRPLPSKKSIGALHGHRTSVIDQYKATLGRPSQFGRFAGEKSLGGSQNHMPVEAESEDVEDDTTIRQEISRQDSETTRLHNKTSTQRLHERINMLGKAREVRPSKSTPFNASVNQPLYPQLDLTQSKPQLEESNPQVMAKPDVPAPKQIQHEVDINDDDEWIAPVSNAAPRTEATRPPLFKSHTAEVVEQLDINSYGATEAAAEQPREFSQGSPQRGLFGAKANASTAVTASPTKSSMVPVSSMLKPISVSNGNMSVESFTPMGSPSSRRLPDGPLSASKAKLYSVLRSAKGIFASSAGVSAQAKMEALSAPLPPRHFSKESLVSSNASIMPTTALYPNLQPTTSESHERRTRSSTEKDQKRRIDDANDRRKVSDDLEKAREKERQKAAAHAAKNGGSRPPSPIKSLRSVASSRETLVETDDQMPPPPPPKTLLPQTSQQRLRDARRVPKPVKEQPAKAKPVTVRMPSQRAGHATASNVLSQSTQESAPPPVPPKQPTISAKSSNQSLHASASTTNLKASASAAQQARKALEAAKKKKEEDAKAAQRKAEQKRELEQKKLAKLEEDRRLEQQRKAAEQVRAQEAKKRQLAEAKRLEQQRKDAQRPPSRNQQQTDLESVLRQDQAHTNLAHPRADLGAARPVARLPLVPDQQRPIVQINPAKPPKRMLQYDPDEEQSQRPPVQRNPPSYQQLDGKRRKTNEEEDPVAEQRRSVMAPPIRHSNMRKVSEHEQKRSAARSNYCQEPNKYPYANTSNQQSMLVKTVTQQHQIVHIKPPVLQSDMSKFANARIPFAENPNPPAGPSGQNQIMFKTPGKPASSSAVKSAAKSAAKSSPHYPNSESINLPEIATDSEDEDSDNEFAAPEWVNSPALRELLAQQQHVDPEHIFGPIAPLHMEEVFKNKDKHRKFRDRTSSAVWTNDKVTEEERRKDREARERLIRDGGWSFQPDN